VRAVKQMLKDRYLADMPIVVAAIDPCFSCTDRLIAIDAHGKKEKEILSWLKLRNYSIAWYKKQGIDFSALNKKLKKRT
jgi:NADH-quinone oxidoreductase subunit D